MACKLSALSYLRIITALGVLLAFWKLLLVLIVVWLSDDMSKLQIVFLLFKNDLNGILVFLKQLHNFLGLKDLLIL